MNNTILILTYASAAAFLAGLQALFNAGVMYLMFQYFKWRYGSGLYPQEAHLYESVNFALLAVIGAAVHYYLGALLARNTDHKWTRLAGVAAACAAVSTMFFSLANDSHFASGRIAALPVVIAYLAGGLLGIYVKEPDNPWKNLRFRIFNK
ncbi:MAG: hypothetical protein ABIG11_10260 [bacterium]